jgi:hypothetical protein
MSETTTSPALEYQVHYYDPQRTGTWVAKFATLEEAERFAVGWRLWGKAAKAQRVGQ